MVRQNATFYKMPANPKYLTFTRTDGNSDLWPKNTTPGAVDGDGNLNWMRRVPLDEATNQRWRNQIGTAVAKSMNNPGECTEFVMQDWPAGYALFDHNKGKGRNPASADVRHDMYLIGSTKANRFRSVPELISHAVWLMSDASEPCSCKYCTNTKSQKSITQGLSQKNILPLSLHASVGLGLHSASPRTKRTARSQITPSDGAKKPRTEHRVYAAVRKPKKDVIPYQTETRYSVAEPREKISDLRSILIRDGAETKRWFREKELVWCKLSRALEGPRGDGLDNIYFWPAVIEEIVIDNTSEQLASPITPSLPQDEETAGGGESVIIEDNPEPTWKVNQGYKYRVSLLAVNYSDTRSEEDLIPYRAYENSPELGAAIGEYRATMEEFDFDSTSGINPDPGEKGPPVAFKDVVLRYAKALIFATELGSLWCLTDEWEFKYQRVLPTPPLQPNPSASANPFAPGGSALNSNPFRPSLPGKQKFSPTGDEITLGEVQVDDKYQGLWWGSERIWTGDLVRLKIDRAAMSPFAIVENYLASPAGPSPRVVEEYQQDDTPEGRALVINLMGAKSRGIYLKIEDIDLAPSDNPDRPNSKHCRVAGQLYELVDHDWEEHTDTSLTKQQATPQTPPRPGGGDPLAQPSPMMISQLRNPDPTLPVTSTTSGVLAPQQPNGSSSTSASAPPRPSSSGRLSNGKLSTPHLPAPVYDLPEPPSDFKFRNITKSGYQVVFSVTLLAGRYYPLLEEHDIIKLLTEQADKESDQDTPNGAGVKRQNFLLSLSGLAAGYHNCISPHRHTDSRVAMLQKADRMADAQLKALKNMRMEDAMIQKRRESEVDQLMDVDPAEPHRS